MKISDTIKGILRFAIGKLPPIHPNLPVATPGRVVRGAMDDAEVLQTQQLINAQGGGEFIGQPVRNFPAIDGWLDGVPVQLKKISASSGGNWVRAISRESNRAWKKLRNTNYQGVRFHITAHNLTKAHFIDFATNGPGFAKILQGQSIIHISVLASDGLAHFF